MRLTPRRLALPFLFTALFASSAFVGRRVQLPEGFKVHEVGGGIAYIEGTGGGNIGVLQADDGLFVIDDQLANVGESVRATLATFSGKEVRYVLNTHWHSDHVGNNAIVANGAPILAHENVRRRMNGDPRVDGRKNDSAPEGALPVVTYESGLRMYVGGESVDVVHFANAHTDGDSVVFFENANVVHMGDIMFSGLFPFIDLESGGSVDGYAAAIEAVLKRIDDETKVIPGHGPLSTKADLAKLHAMLTDCAERVRAALADGKTLEDMKREGLIGDYGDWSWGFIPEERFLETLVADLGA